MKKFFLVSIVVLFSAVIVNAQKGNISVGGQFNYASKNTMVGLGVNVQYEFVKNVRLEPEFIYYFENDGISILNCNLNFHYLIKPGGHFTLYPIAGVSYARFMDDFWDDENRIGANVGFGAEYAINEHFRFYTEERIQILKEWNQSVTCLGIKYKF